MTFKKFKIGNFGLLLLIVIALFSCESNFKEVQKQNFSEFAPSGEADDFNMKYTDSGKIKSILISPKMLDYASVTYPFTEFPKGINVTLFDINNKNTTQNQQYTFTSATPSYWYKVISKTGTSVTLDRNLPVLSGNTNKSYFYVFNSGNSINNFYGNSSPIQYWDELTLTFID